MTRLKQIFLLIGVSFLTLSVSNCGTSKGETFVTNPPFTIGEAYAQDWIAGVQGGGSGTNIYINIHTIKEGVVFNNVFFGKKATPLITSPNVRVQYIGYFKNNSSQAVIMDENPVKEAANKPPMISPFELGPTEAVISYTYQDALYYYKIDAVEIKEPLAYPGVNPNGID